MEFKYYLKTVATHDGSDIYLSAGAPPCAKFHGVLKPLEERILTADDLKKIAYGTMNEEQIAEFERKPEMNLAISLSDIGRFRVNIFKQRSTISMVIQNIKTVIPNADRLSLLPSLKEVMMPKHGLILFVGATGSGKSISLAALIDHRNRSSEGCDGEIGES